MNALTFVTAAILAFQSYTVLSAAHPVTTHPVMPGVPVLTPLPAGQKAAGMEWVNATPAAQWSRRKAPEILSHLDDLWLLGGVDGSRSFHDVWRSADGVQWSLVTATPPWTERYGFGAVTFNGRMWLMGGYDRSAALRNDVWSSADGIAWTCAIPAAPWAGRCDAGVVVHANAIWVIGGLRQQPATMCNDVWKSTDGVRWTCVTAAAPWSPRHSHALASFNGRLYVMGGYSGTPRNDVWSSADGVTWRQETPDAPWVPRFRQRAVVWNNALMLVGGCSSDATSFSDVWSTSDGMQWQCDTGVAEWPRRNSQRVVVHQDHVWLAGGVADGICLNDVWRHGVVLPPNEPPTIAVVPDYQEVVVGSVAQVAVECIDPEGMPLTIAVEGLPEGAMLNDDSTLLSWTPAPHQTGIVAITFTVTDSGAPPLAAAAVATILVSRPAPPPLVVETRAVPEAVEEAPYSAAVEASGGVPPYTWAVAAGALPQGIVLLPSGVIEGSTLATGAFAFTAQATDSEGVTAEQPLILVVQPLPAGTLRIVTRTLPDAVQHHEYNTLVRAEGGRRPYRWSIIEGVLPPGIRLNRHSGLLYGKPRIATTIPFVIQVADKSGATAVRRLTLTVLGPVVREPCTVDFAAFQVDLSPRHSSGRDTLMLRMQVAVPDDFVCRADMRVALTVGTYAVQAGPWIVTANGNRAEWRSVRLGGEYLAGERITMHIGQAGQGRVCQMHLAVNRADLAACLNVPNATVINGMIAEPVQVTVDELVAGATPTLRLDALKDVRAYGHLPETPSP